MISRHLALWVCVCVLFLRCQDTKTGVKKVIDQIPLSSKISFSDPDVWRGSTVQNSGRPDKWRGHGSSSAENVRLALTSHTFHTSQILNRLNCLYVFILRDVVYFSDSWISRIKSEVGDNWRLKVNYCSGVCALLAWLEKVSRSV